MSTNRGIPTQYKGVRFRSRLEAKWAAFFDAVSWPWAYEPFDLSGYIPDFALHFEHAPVVVEVKPALHLSEMDIHAQHAACAGWDGEILVLGAAVWPGPGRHSDDVIGWLCERALVDGERELAGGPGVAFRCLDCGALSLRSADHSYRCRVAGCYGGNAHVGTLEHGELATLWASAGNRVQWKAAV